MKVYRDCLNGIPQLDNPAFLTVFDANGNNAVVSGGPAAKAGIRNRDIITKINDMPVNERNNLAGLLAEFAPGDKINLTVLRDGQQRTLEVELGQLRQ